MVFYPAYRLPLFTYPWCSVVFTETNASFTFVKAKTLSTDLGYASYRQSISMQIYKKKDQI